MSFLYMTWVDSLPQPGGCLRAKEGAGGLKRVTMHVLPCRRAIELAFATCYIFAGSRPIFREVGEITFKKPVEVGDLLRLHSTVLYTHKEPSNGQVCARTLSPCKAALVPLYDEMLKQHLCACVVTIPAFSARMHSQSRVQAAYWHTFKISL